MHAMIEGYQANGWQVYLLAMNTSRHHVDEHTLQGLYTNLHAFEWVEIDNDFKPIKILKNYLFSKQPEHVERFYHESFQNRLLDVVSDFAPDVIQVESIYLTTYLPALKDVTKAVKVLRNHNIEYHIWNGVAMKSKNKIKRKYFQNLTKRLKSFEKDAWRKYDLVMPITEKEAFHIRRYEKNLHMLVAPFSIDISKFPLTHYNEKWMGYHLGAMDWIPNRDGIRWFLAEVWPKIHAVVPGFEFHFGGRKMPEEFREMRNDGIFCHGEVPDAGDFIADKNILIVPVASAGGIRVKILEAMAAGKVVITSGEGIKGIDARVGAHYLLARKPDEYVRAIKWCFMHKDKAEQMGRDARQLVAEKYEYRTVIKTVIDELELLIKLRN